MKKSVLKFPKSIFEELKRYLLKDNNEDHAFVFGNRATSRLKESKEISLAEKIVRFKTKEIETSPVSVKIDKALVNLMFRAFIESDNNVLISCHSHPFERGEVHFSSIDDANDRRLFEYFYREVVRHKPDARMYTMVFGQNSIALRGYDYRKKRFVALDEVVVTGYPMQYIYPTNSADNQHIKPDEIHHRQVLAFGEEGQERLGKLKVGLVGAGGTGSILAEGLVKLGVNSLIIIDEDKLELSNLNRWQGGRLADVGRHKVSVLEELLSAMSDTVRIETFKKSLFDKEVIDCLKDCDVIIGAVDDDKARYILNKLSLIYLIPYLDCSSGIIVKEGKIAKIAARNVGVIPGVTECMECSDRYYDKAKLIYHFSGSRTREEAKRKKYIDDDDTDIKSPSVYPLNMLSVSTLLTEFINLFTGFRGAFYRNIFIDTMHMQRQSAHAWEVVSPSPRCIDCNDRIALGDREKVWNLFA